MIFLFLTQSSDFLEDQKNAGKTNNHSECAWGFFFFFLPRHPGGALLSHDISISKSYGPAKSSKKETFCTTQRTRLQDRKDIQHDRSDNIDHITYNFSQRKSIAHVLDKRVYFRFTQNNRLLKGPPKERELSFR